MAALTGQARRWTRRLLVALLGCVVLTLVVRAWLLRDPEPHFRARYRGIASVEISPKQAVDEYVEQDIVLRDSSGLRVDLRTRRRADLTADAKLPLVVLLGGHARGKESVSYVGNPRENLVVAVAYPFDGNERVNGVAVVMEVPAIRRAILDTPPAVMLALDWLLAQPDVDPTRVELVGASFGVPFAAVIAALDRRVSRAWLVQGGANNYALILAGLERDMAFAPARRFVASLANVLAAGPRFDPARWVGQIAPRPVVMINTVDDDRIPRATAEALHAAAKEPKEVVWLPGLHMQPNRPDVLRDLVDAVFSRMN